MTGAAAQFSLIVLPFLAGNVCSILNRQPKLSVIGRPLSRTILAFCLGTWFLNRPPGVAHASSQAAFELLPWILLAHLLISFIPCDDQTDPRGLRFDALLYSASFLSAICLTQNLVFLILFGESLAVSTWLSTSGEDRRRMVKRSLATFVLIAAGSALILSRTETGEFSRFPGEPAATDHSDAGRFATAEPDSSLAIRAGVLLLVVGLTWRLGFFPFEPLSRSAQTLGGFQRQVSLVTAATLELTILLPRLSGYGNLGLMLLFTLAVPTLVRETWRSRKWNSAEELWADWWRASAALMWLSLGLALFSMEQEEPLPGLWLPAGLEAVRLELLSSLGAFVVLTAVTQAYRTLGHPLFKPASLMGLLWTTPFYGFVMTLGILNWVGVPFLSGFAPRWGVIASLLEAGGTGFEGAGYFLLIAVLVICCQVAIVSLGLSAIQSMCDPGPATRPTGQVRVWRVWPFAILLFAIVVARWM